MTKTIDTTAAKIGRSMKKCEIFIALLDFRFRRPRERRRRRSPASTFCPGRARISPLTMTRSVLLEAGLDHALAVGDLAERDVCHLDDVVVADQQHEFLGLLGADGGIGNGERVIARRPRHPDTREHARA